MTVSARPATSELPLLETKLYCPKWSADRVSRRRLIDCIHPQRKLTLISAPAGFGKTTLLAEWIAAVPGRTIAWVSLDASDNTPAIFWTYVIGALQSIQPTLGKQALSLVQSSQPPETEAILMTLLNELTVIKADVALVLDDYHVIETQAIHDGIGFLLSHLPPHMHLIIASRADPPLSLARLRSHGELTELRAIDLRFTPDEAATFLNQAMGLEIAAADVAALEQRTEGWIAGLQLAALSLQGREDISDFVAAFSGDDRYIVDYLLEEVLQRQSDRVRRFLLQTSILERLSGSLCDAVTDQTDGQEMLATLERGNLFLIPLDNKRQWYRYHHLFTDVLQAHALKEYSEQMPTLHGQASKWYEQNELFADAICHALAAQDFDHAADLIEQVWPAMRNRQQETTVLSWLKVLPDSLIRIRPVLSVANAIALLNTGQTDAIEDRLQDAERALAQAESVVADQDAYRSLPAAIANTRAFHAQALGDFAGAITHAEQALALLPAEDDSERGVTAAFLGLAYWTSGDVAAAYQSFAAGLQLFQKRGNTRIAICATSVLAQMGLAQGRLRATITACHQALQLADQQPEPILQGTRDLYLVLSELHYEQGHLDTAHQLLQKGQELREQGSTVGFNYFPWLVKAQLTAAEGDLDKALAQLQEAAQLYRRSPVPDVRPIAALQVRWWLRQGQLTEALNWVKECGLSADDEPSYLREYEHLTLARVAIAQYRHNGTDDALDQIINLLARLLNAAEAQNRTGSTIKILVVLALAYEALGEIEDAILQGRGSAIAALEQALILAEPEGQVRLFAECGPPMVRLLRAVKTRNITPAYTQSLLTAAETWGQPTKAPSPLPQGAERSRSAPSTPSPLIEPLSQRELEVLRLLNTELTGPEIAHELVVALSTVRTHTKRIYSKLNVTNRRAAVKRAAELELL